MQPVTERALFPVSSLLDGSLTDFDLFLSVKGEDILYAAPGYCWTRDETTRLLAHGWSDFRVDAAQAPLIQMYLQLARLPLVEKNQAPARRINSLQDLAASFTQCLYSGEVSAAAVHFGEKIAQGIVDCLMENQASVKEISGLMDHDQYTFYHSARVAVFATAMSISMGVTDEKHLQRIATGGLFHDVGKKDVPLEVINKPGALDQAEWQKMRAHPSQGHEALKAAGLSLETMEIVLHHHERMNGSGYPHGLQQSGIMTEVQIAAVADIYDALTSSRSYQKRKSRYEALDFMKHKLLGTDISPTAFRGLVAALT